MQSAVSIVTVAQSKFCLHPLYILVNDDCSYHPPIYSASDRMGGRGLFHEYICRGYPHTVCTNKGMILHSASSFISFSILISISLKLYDGFCSMWYNRLCIH